MHITTVKMQTNLLQCEGTKMTLGAVRPKMKQITFICPK